MEQERKSMRIGLAIIACALIFRLADAGPVQWLAGIISKPQVASALVFLETGRVVRTGVDLPEPTQMATVPTQPVLREQVCFQQEDANLVELSAVCDYPVDVEAMLTSPLTWDLNGEAPTVLILHTHATEAYTQTEQMAYTPSSLYRTVDLQYNVVRIGEHLAQLLRAEGIQVIHDTTLHDHPDYSDSYAHARKSTRQYLEENPSVCLVVDIHRDALDLSSSKQLTTHAAVKGRDSAQLMMVVGTDAGGNHHPNWEENMALAVKLHTLLEKNNPGICRPISFRNQRFNQDLSTGAMLIEVGAAGNTLEEALVAVEALAEGIVDLSAGAIALSTS